MADFMLAVAATLEREKGLVDNLADPGGITNWGISIRSHPTLTAAAIRQMTQTTAIGIYRAEYWNPLYDQIQSQPLAQSLFDFGVTSGMGTAVKVLQIILFGRNSTAIDGRFGQGTLDAMNRENPADLLRDFTAQRLHYYASLNKPEFNFSWFSRALDPLV